MTDVKATHLPTTQGQFAPEKTTSDAKTRRA